MHSCTCRHTQTCAPHGAKQGDKITLRGALGVTERKKENVFVHLHFGIHVGVFVFVAACLWLCVECVLVCALYTCARACKHMCACVFLYVRSVVSGRGL